MEKSIILILSFLSFSWFFVGALIFPPLSVLSLTKPNSSISKMCQETDIVDICFIKSCGSILVIFGILCQTPFSCNGLM